MLERLGLKNFTVFQDEILTFSPGLNVVIGANGTGKSHLLKLAYSIILDSAVVRTHLTQPLDSPGKTEKSLVTNKLKFHRFVGPCVIGKSY